MTVKEHRSALSDLLSTNGSFANRINPENSVRFDLEDHTAEHALQSVKQRQFSSIYSQLPGRILTGACLKQQGSAN